MDKCCVHGKQPRIKVEDSCVKAQRVCAASVPHMDLYTL